MNLTSPPTDSIYKFSAIAGLILFGYMGYFFFMPDEHEKREHELQTELTSLTARLQILEDKLLYNADSASDSIQIQVISGLILDSLSNSDLKNIIYKSSTSIQKEYSDLFKDANIWASKWNSHEYDGEVYYNFSRTTFIVLLYLGEIACIFGFAFWYFNIQKPQDEEHEQRRLRGEILQPCCQSCFKEIIFPQERGTESDGEPSKNFCSDCYINGLYTEPELTFKNASKRLSKKMDELNYSERRKRKGLKKFKNLDRWRRLRKW